MCGNRLATSEKSSRDEVGRESHIKILYTIQPPWTAEPHAKSHSLLPCWIATPAPSFSLSFAINETDESFLFNTTLPLV